MKFAFALTLILVPRLSLADCDDLLGRLVATNADRLERERFDGLTLESALKSPNASAQIERAMTGACAVNCELNPAGKLTVRLERRAFDADFAVRDLRYVRTVNVEDPVFGPARVSFGELVRESNHRTYADPADDVRRAEADAAIALRHGLHPYALERYAARLRDADRAVDEVVIEGLDPHVAAWFALSRDFERVLKAKVRAQVNGAEVVIEATFEDAKIDAVRAAYVRLAAE